MRHHVPQQLLLVLLHLFVIGLDLEMFLVVGDEHGEQVGFPRLEEGSRWWRCHWWLCCCFRHRSTAWQCRTSWPQLLRPRTVHCLRYIFRVILVEHEVGFGFSLWFDIFEERDWFVERKKKNSRFCFYSKIHYINNLRTLTSPQLFISLLQFYFYYNINPWVFFFFFFFHKSISLFIFNNVEPNPKDLRQRTIQSRSSCGDEVLRFQSVLW